jgi:hypothetical protein
MYQTSEAGATGTTQVDQYPLRRRSPAVPKRSQYQEETDTTRHNARVATDSA